MCRNLGEGGAVAQALYLGTLTVGRHPPQGISRQVQGAVAQGYPPTGGQAPLYLCPPDTQGHANVPTWTHPSPQGSGRAKPMVKACLWGSWWAWPAGSSGWVYGEPPHCCGPLPLAQLNLGPPQPGSSQHIRGTLEALQVIWRHRPFSGPRSPCHRSPLSPSPPPWEQGLTGQGRTACLPRPGVAHGCPLRARSPGEGAPLGV